MKRVLVTGGSGSFGRAFTRHILKNGAERVVIYSRGEHLQEDMAREFNDPRLRFFIGDVRDQKRLTMAMHGIDTVVHAAAMKVVPICEYNPFEAVMTNINGAENVCRAAIEAGVGRVMALSTDKAVNPVNLYGATKLAAEKIFVAANNIAAGRCMFSVVRYGNVVGSRGSVLPLFQSILASNLSVLPITDRGMTRFWITMDQAVDFVSSALDMMQGREIFIPKIPSIYITDLAQALCPGYTADIIGMRPGEKLHEVLMTEDESHLAMEAWDRYIINGGPTNVAPNTRYASNTNAVWLTVEQIRAMTCP